MMKRMERWLNNKLESVDDYRVGLAHLIPLRLYVRSLWEYRPLFELEVSWFEFLFRPKKVQTLLVSLTLLKKNSKKTNSAAFIPQQWSNQLISHYQQTLIFPTNMQGAAGGSTLFGKQLSTFSPQQQMLAAQQKFTELEQSILDEEINRLTYGQANAGGQGQSQSQSDLEKVGGVPPYASANGLWSPDA